MPPYVRTVRPKARTRTRARYVQYVGAPVDQAALRLMSVQYAEGRRVSPVRKARAPRGARLSSGGHSSLRSCGLRFSEMSASWRTIWLTITSRSLSGVSCSRSTGLLRISPPCSYSRMMPGG